MSGREMIINCPSCDTSYKIDPAVLGGQGRKVRCTSCGVRWFVAPPPPGKDAPAPEAPASESLASEPPTSGAAAAQAPSAGPTAGAFASGPAPDRGQPREQASPAAAGGPGPFAPLPAAARVAAPASRSTGTLGWLGVTLALVLLTAAVLGRNEIVAAAPGALPVFQRLGLPVTVESELDLQNVRAERVEEDGTPTLLVLGEIVNLGGSGRDLPALRIALLDSQRREIEFGLVDPPVAALPPGAVTRFEARLVDPPAAASTFKVTLDETPARR
ncbi:DUF3426 domain-containing protein [Geminicoccaceae bacterium 1502E]|nr:DUF3426 domain-containing protein [Geminicoccaceae bacterium 1502E]